MVAPVKVAFERQIAVLPLTAILPLRSVAFSLKQSAKFQRIAHSIGEVGIIEPLVVAPMRQGQKQHLLLDGHSRYAILCDQGATEARCLIADDDEAFTYNKRVNRLATIQEHYMIVRALERGVSEEKLARALNLDVKGIKRQRNLLDGVCPEVIELLQDKTLNSRAFEILRKMKPTRQVEVAEIMVSVGNFTMAYAKALLGATRQADLVNADKPKKVGGLTPEQMARLERETATVNQDFKALEDSYGDDVLNLVVASGYLARLIGNDEIKRYLQEHHPDLLSELKVIVNAVSLDQGGASLAA
jgi:ParB-like chromosome segregation protein Spo0J